MISLLKALAVIFLSIVIVGAALIMLTIVPWLGVLLIIAACAHLIDKLTN